MIVYVAKVINLFAITIQNLILLSSLVGQVIIATATAVSSACYYVTRNLLCFLQIVYEDNKLIFSEEVPNAVNNIANIVTSHLAYLQNDLILSCENITVEMFAMIGSLKWLFKSVVLILSEASLILKNGIIFLGNTLWQVVSFPVQLIKLLKIILDTLTKIALTLLMDIVKMLVDITIFLTDFPVESLIGLASFVIVTCLYVCYKEVIDTKIAYIYWMLNRRFRYIYYILYNYFNDYETRVISRLATGHEINASPSVSGGGADIDETDALCVICQERQKCVLTLPCRHVCLCTECCLQLYGYQRTCPICRTFICHSVTVYL